MVFILILVLSLIVQHVTPWWIISIISFGSAWLGSKSAGRAFLSGFLAIFVLWTAMAFWIYSGNDGVLADRVGQMLGGLPGWSLPVISALIGGLAAGVSAWAGYLMKKAFSKPESNGDGMSGLPIQSVR